ncbi:MAG: hypothetical protein IT336_14980 [Thermomicrobiales bacterium]|nr:hypothetical protein [Thermomicrobiales bacterium]
MVDEELADVCPVVWVIPVVADGRVELSAVETGIEMLGFDLTSGLVQGMEDGIDDALTAAGARPTGVMLSDGLPILQVAPASLVVAVRFSETPG